MEFFQYLNNILHAEDTALDTLAEQFGTPLYVYSRATIEENWQAFNNAISLPHKICYAVKANSNIAILNLLARLGSGFDIVSAGELERVLIAGGDPQKIVFSGVGKNEFEINRALDVGIYCFNVESIQEIYRIQKIAHQKNIIANISLRINPDIDAETHHYISTGLKENKFGLETETVLLIAKDIKKLSHINLIGIASHIGSQLTSLIPFQKALEKLLELATQLASAGFQLKHINVGGGLGVRYHNEYPPSIHDYVSQLTQRLKNTSYEIIFEPGRAIVANAGILLTRIEYIKNSAHKNFAITDAGMNDFMRPALYNAWQEILSVNVNHSIQPDIYDVVDPVCESADFFGKDRKLSIRQGDLLAIKTCGAYGFSMTSNYNSRPRGAEVLVDCKNTFLIREREQIENLFADEKLIFDSSPQQEWI